MEINREMEKKMQKAKSKMNKFAAILLSGVAAFAATLTALGNSDSADAAASMTLPSSVCHAALDNNGANINNSGALTNTAAAATSIYCPVTEGIVTASAVDGVSVYGNESTNGANSRTCSCYLNPVQCLCSAATSWSNNQGVVASNLSVSEWSFNQTQEFSYILHSLTQNSTLAGMYIFEN